MSEARIVLSADTVAPLTRDDYAADRARVTAALDAGGALGVYEIGSVGAPGISDLDVVAVFPDGADLAAASRPLAAALAATTRTFLHAPWAIHDRHLPRLGGLFAVRSMRELHDGSERTIVQAPHERRIWNIEATCSVLALLLGRRRTTTRSALCLLNGLRYNVDLAAADGIRSAHAAPFTAAITHLRSQWFALPPAQRNAELIATWRAGVPVARELLDGYAQWLATRTEGAPGAWWLPVPGTQNVYHFGPSEAAAPRRPRPFANVVPLPAALGPLFVHLATPGCGLDRWLAPVALAAPVAPPFDAEFGAALHRYVHGAADYLKDLLARPSPFLLLGGGTLGAVRATPAGRASRLLRRLGQRLLPVGH
jgi:hypothetical protein